MKTTPLIHLPLFLLALAPLFSSAISRDPHGNITIRWDIVSWTPDGYVALINITNYQKYRPVENPGWKIEWTWPQKQVLWNVFGARPVTRGNCSRFKGNVPRSCAKRVVIVDQTAEISLNEQISGCCKGGILLSRPQTYEKSTAAVQITVGLSGTTNETVRPPRNFSFLAPRGGYSCGPAERVPLTRFITPDLRRVTQALVTWQVVCTYSSLLAERVPRCCVSMSSLDQKTKATCPSCACGCKNEPCHGREETLVPEKECKENHNCPLTINWQKENRGRVRISMTNLNYKMNYSDWTLLVDHSNLNHLTNVFHANHKRLSPESVVFWGVKDYNQVITTRGTKNSTISWDIGFGVNNEGGFLPGAVYLNGDRCVMP